jgi:hypothetical protein
LVNVLSVLPWVIHLPKVWRYNRGN